MGDDFNALQWNRITVYVCSLSCFPFPGKQVKERKRRKPFSPKSTLHESMKLKAYKCVVFSNYKSLYVFMLFSYV